MGAYCGNGLCGWKAFLDVALPAGTLASRAWRDGTKRICLLPDRSAESLSVYAVYPDLSRLLLHPIFFPLFFFCTYTYTYPYIPTYPPNRALMFPVTVSQPSYIFIDHQRLCDLLTSVSAGALTLGGVGWGQRTYVANRMRERRQAERSSAQGRYLVSNQPTRRSIQSRLRFSRFCWMESALDFTGVRTDTAATPHCARTVPAVHSMI